MIEVMQRDPGDAEDGVCVTLYHWTNKNVMAFDQYGQQMATIQRASPIEPEDLDAWIGSWQRAGLLSDHIEIIRHAVWK